MICQSFVMDWHQKKSECLALFIALFKVGDGIIKSDEWRKCRTAECRQIQSHDKTSADAALKCRA